MTTTYYCMRKKLLLITFKCLMLSILTIVHYSVEAQGKHIGKRVKFIPFFVAAESFESVGVMDVDNDGLLDIVSGDFWYKNSGDPTTAFLERTKIGDQKRFDEYYDDFSTIPLDVNADGKMDFITGGWFEKQLRWVENPGNTTEWPVHIIAKTGHIETVQAWDIDNDGIVDIVPNTPGDSMHYFRRNGNGEFIRVDVDAIKSHGLGFGDVNNDGRKDFVVSKGWVENKGENKWQYHPEFTIEDASVPILVVDVNQDGKNDLIIGAAHSYGLFWFEQIVDENGLRGWKKHVISDDASQFHTMRWEDINNDNKPELITGKRFRAHNNIDPGAHDNVGLYYFQWNGKKFIKNVIAYGPPGVGKGTGIYFEVADLMRRGKKDIIVAGKDGLWVFYNYDK